MISSIFSICILLFVILSIFTAPMTIFRQFFRLMAVYHGEIAETIEA